MPEPFAGLVVVAEYGSPLAADLAVGVLREAGIEATASCDPALRSAFPRYASDRVVEVVVRAEDAEVAVAALEAHDRVPLPPEFERPEAG